MEVSAIQEQRSLTQRFLAAERRIRKTKHTLVVGSTLVRQLEHVQHTVKWLLEERRARVEGHRAAVRPEAAGN